MVVQNAKFGRGWVVLTKGNIDYVDFGVQNKRLYEDELKGEIIRVNDKYYECLTNAIPLVYTKIIYGEYNQVKRTYDKEYKKSYFGIKKVKVIDIETKKQQDLEFKINYFTGLRKIIRKV